MEVMPAFQYPQHILVFVTLLSECIHRSEIEFNSFGPWLYNIKAYPNLPSNFTMQKEDSPSHQNVGTYIEY
jgi:hypothetical protein